MALLFFGNRPGDTHGLEVAVIDWLALVLLLATPGRARPVPYRFALAGYLGVALLSAALAPWPLGALGYVWKLCRMLLVFAAICRAGDDRRVPAALLGGMTLGVV